MSRGVGHEGKQRARRSDWLLDCDKRVERDDAHTCCLTLGSGKNRIAAALIKVMTGLRAIAVAFPP